MDERWLKKSRLERLFESTVDESPGGEVLVSWCKVDQIGSVCVLGMCVCACVWKRSVLRRYRCTK